jgi:homoserine O-acetyltransferase/O-succinyltransferase
MADALRTLREETAATPARQPASQIPAGILAHWPSALKFYSAPEPLQLSSGSSLRDAQIGYQSWGQLNAAGDNAIWVCHALTGTTDVAAWWSGLFGAGKALDPERYFIVCANVLGGCYGSAGALMHPLAAKFPRISIADMAQHQYRLARHLGIKKIQLLIGGSMGGFQALAWTQLLQADIDIAKLALVATSYRQPPQACALAELQCEAIRLDPHFREGHYDPHVQPRRGLALARRLGHLSYRCETELNARFDRARRADQKLQVLSYLDHQGDKLAKRFDANAYITISEAMNDFSLTEAELARIDAPSLIVSIHSDWLYPPAEQQQLARLLPHAQLLQVRSDFGHDGFLNDAASFNTKLQEFMRQN